jgi:diguanylate cyclase (GGDEF)-like protein
MFRRIFHPRYVNVGVLVVVDALLLLYLQADHRLLVRPHLWQILVIAGLVSLSYRVDIGHIVTDKGRLTFQMPEAFAAPAVVIWQSNFVLLGILGGAFDAVTRRRLPKMFDSTHILAKNLFDLIIVRLVVTSPALSHVHILWQCVLGVFLYTFTDYVVMVIWAICEKNEWKDEMFTLSFIAPVLACLVMGTFVTAVTGALVASNSLALASLAGMIVMLTILAALQFSTRSDNARLKSLHDIGLKIKNFTSREELMEYVALHAGQLLEAEDVTFTAHKPSSGPDLLCSVYYEDNIEQWIVATGRLRSSFDEYSQSLLDGVAAMLTSALFSVGLVENLARRAMHDELTEILNRRGLEAALAESVASVDGSKVFGLGIFDLDRFKEVNDTYGHETGDKMLKIFASRLKSHVTENDVVARIGGDEFVVVFNDLGDDGDVAAIAARVADEVCGPVTLGGYSLEILTSVGSSTWGVDGDTVGTLLNAADERLYKNKRATSVAKRADLSI